MTSAREDFAPRGPAAGYTTDLHYPSAFIFHQSPLQVVWAAATGGARTRPLTKPFTYCDLGCGDGMTLNVLAADYPHARFLGVDLNDGHLATARGLAARARLGNVEYLQASFTGLADADLPPLDFIAVNGVYSWVEEDVRAAIHSFVRDGLKPGGLLCVQYSCLPGTAVHDPLFRYLRACADRESGDSAERFRAALSTLARLGPLTRFFKAHPQAAEILRGLARKPLGQAAHDVLNHNVRGFYFHEVRDSFAAIGLRYMASATLKTNHPELMMGREAYAAFKEIVDGASVEFRESILDFVLDSFSRCDVFRKPADDDDHDVSEAGWSCLSGLYLHPVASPAELARGASAAAQGTAVDLSSPLHLAVIEACADGAATIGDVLAAPALATFARHDIERAIAQLFLMRALNVLVRPPRPAGYRSDRSYRFMCPLNAILLDETLLAPDAIAFASPVLGTALMIPPHSRLRLLALLGGDLERAWERFRRHYRQVRDANGKLVTSFEQFRAGTTVGLSAFGEWAAPDLLRYGLLEEV